MLQHNRSFIQRHRHLQDDKWGNGVFLAVGRQCTLTLDKVRTQGSAADCHVCLILVELMETRVFSVSRLKMKPDVVLRRLAIAVASNDHSYMPQLVSVAVGKNRRSLQEIRDIRIPSNVTGYVALLENANITHPCESAPVSLSVCVYLGLVCSSTGACRETVFPRCSPSVKTDRATEEYRCIQR